MQACSPRPRRPTPHCVQDLARVRPFFSVTQRPGGLAGVEEGPTRQCWSAPVTALAFLSRPVWFGALLCWFCRLLHYIGSACMNEAFVKLVSSWKVDVRLACSRRGSHQRHPLPHRTRTHTHTHTRRVASYFLRFSAPSNPHHSLSDTCFKLYRVGDSKGQGGRRQQTLLHYHHLDDTAAACRRRLPRHHGRSQVATEFGCLCARWL